MKLREPKISNFVAHPFDLSPLQESHGTNSSGNEAGNGLVEARSSTSEDRSLARANRSRLGRGRLLRSRGRLGGSGGHIARLLGSRDNRDNSDSGVGVGAALGNWDSSRKVSTDDDR